MNNTLGSLILSALIYANSSFATPILSDGGSKLTGVDVGGVLYDVMFGDGVVGDVYTGVNWDTDREEEANAVSDAIVAALNIITGVDPRDINGCGDTYRCVLFLPDSSIDLGLGERIFEDSNPAGNSAYSGGTWSVPIPGTSLISFPANTDTARLLTGLALVTYEKAVQPAPTPATIFLFGLGLASLGISRRNRN